MQHQSIQESSQQRADRLLDEDQARRAGTVDMPAPRRSTVDYAIELISVGHRRLLVDMAVVLAILISVACATSLVAVLMRPDYPAPPASGAYSATKEATSRPAARPPLGGGANREAR